MVWSCLSGLLLCQILAVISSLLQNDVSPDDHQTGLAGCFMGLVSFSFGLCVAEL